MRLTGAGKFFCGDFDAEPSVFYSASCPCYQELGFIVKKSIAFCFTFVFSLGFVFADYNSSKFPDSAEIRRAVKDDLLKAPLDMIKSYEDTEVENRVGECFQMRVEETDSEYAIIIAPRSELNMDLFNPETNTHNVVRAAVYQKGSQGSWILFRDKEKGNPLRIEWRFNADPEIYLQIRPDTKKSFVDIVVYNSYAARSVPLGIPFDSVYTASFEDMKRWTKSSLPWSRVDVKTGLFNDSLQIVGTIKENLPSFVFADDAAYNERGQLKSILSGKDFYLKDDKDKPYKPNDPHKHFLSGFGFIKWIVDGIVEPVTGYGVTIRDSVEPTIEYNNVGKMGVMSQTWNLTLALDWCRNLAAKAMSVRSTRDVDYKSGGVDVKNNFFVADIIDGKFVNSTGYIQDTGYRTENVKAVLYTLAVTEPGWFYLGAVRQNSTDKYDEFVYNNCAAFFPYFNDHGKFGCFVFEMGKEISLDDFMEKYKGSYLHLERVKSTDSFYPYAKK